MTQTGRRKLKGCHQFQPNAQTDAGVTLVKLEVTSCAATPVQVPSSRGLLCDKTLSSCYCVRTIVNKTTNTVQHQQ